jgi:hypothetical protein
MLQLTAAGGFTITSVIIKKQFHQERQFWDRWIDVVIAGPAVLLFTILARRPFRTVAAHTVESA